MKNIWLILAFFSIVFISCKDETNIVNTNTQPQGCIKISLEKSTTPSEVSYIKVLLTKNGLAPIADGMDVLSDSTSNLTLNQMQTGNWQIKVDAYNSQGTIVYSGENVVDILADKTSKIDLMLLSSGTGLGEIKFSISWINSVWSVIWADNPQGPVIVGSISYDCQGVANPCVLFDDGLYKMWYTAIDMFGSGHIIYATSVDGIIWTKKSNPVFSPSSNGFDNQAVTQGKILKMNGTYKMYYTAKSKSGNVSIGLATSVDGINWTRMSNPVLKATLAWENEVYSSDILYTNGNYSLYYYANGQSGVKIGLANSSDGVNFVKKSQPIIEPSFAWENDYISSPSVIYDDGAFKMVYIAGDDGEKIGYAESNDGTEWTKKESPIFLSANISNAWLRTFNSLQLLKKNNLYQIYFSGLILDREYSEIGQITKINYKI